MGAEQGHACGEGHDRSFEVIQHLHDEHPASLHRFFEVFFKAEFLPSGKVEAVPLASTQPALPENPAFPNPLR